MSLSENGFRPPNSTTPELGGSSAPRMYNKVLFPHPEGPTIDADSPLESLKLMSVRIERAPFAVR